MDLPIAYNNPALMLLVMLTCVCVIRGSAEQNLRENESRERSVDFTATSSRIFYKQSRFRRDLYKVAKCSDSQCCGNMTTFFTRPRGCYCDEACYEIFSDCCPDL